MKKCPNIVYVDDDAITMIDISATGNSIDHVRQKLSLFARDIPFGETDCAYDVYQYVLTTRMISFYIFMRYNLYLFFRPDIKHSRPHMLESCQVQIILPFRIKSFFVCVYRFAHNTGHSKKNIE